MCGIAGIYALNGPAVDPGLLEKMRDSMVHRGPNGAGLWISPDRRVGLGHRRLSIIDLSDAATQPMTNEDETLWVVFNGEIYNHAEIRAELQKMGGHRWRTDHSDTEVILHAYETWGMDCLEKFRGMFAIALWDGRKRELILVRDRIGVKPLYYSFQNGRLAFASEIKALLQDPAQKRAVNETAFYHYLTFLTTPAPDTLFEGIHKMPPGTWMKFRSDGTVQTRKYWDVWDHAKPLTGVSEKEITERLIAELRVSVQLRKVSDVPVGVFLSGGIDSSTNAALFSEGGGGNLETFTIGYEGKYKTYSNELTYARQMAEFTHAKHHERLLNADDLLDFLPSMIYHQDEPLADPVCVPLYYVSKLAHDNGVIVCQVGEGADELFCGYPFWKNMLRFQQADSWPVPRGLKRLGLNLLDRAGKGKRPYYELLRRGSAGEPIFWSGAEAFTEMQKYALLSPRLREKFKNMSSFEVIQPIYERFQAKAWEKSPLNWMSYMDLSLRLPELLLMRVDKMTMATSLEGRVPFLDHKFVELAMSIPQSIKYQNGELKHLLKKAVRGLIPDEIIDRKKQGFGVPIYEWFFDRLGAHAKEELVTFCDETDFLDKQEVLRLFNTAKNQKLWYVLNFALWWRHYIAGSMHEKASAVNCV